MTNRLKTISSMATCFIFGAALLLPLVFTDFKGGEVSETENRVLAKFPDVFMNGSINREFPRGVYHWLNDNIGFRSEAQTLNEAVVCNIAKTVPGPVNFGRDGWLFYTNDDSLEIGEGTYSVSEARLKIIAGQQQAYSDDYKQRGIEYYYLVNPQKSGIYPEYISTLGTGSFAVGTSPVDIAVDYVAKNTDVKIFNPKTALLDAKANGWQVFYRTDTHYTLLGAYTVAKALCGFMGIPDPPMPEMARETDFAGDLRRLSGVLNTLGLETAPSLDVEQILKNITCIVSENKNNYHATGLESISVVGANDYDEFWKGLNAIGNDGSYFWGYENPTAPGGVLLIYGDSQVNSVGRLRLFFSHYFSRVVSIGQTYSYSREIEDYVKPDVVLVDIVERYIGH